MPRTLFVLAAALVACFGLLYAKPSRAQEAQSNAWKIVKWNGDVQAIGPRGEPIIPLDQAVLPPGSKIVTGASSRAMMTRGGDTVVVSEFSILRIPTSVTPGVTPSIVQNRGSITFDIEPRPVQHFSVETPHLGAVVKGTRFTVTLAQGATRVDVIRGAVEVQDFKTGQSALIESNRWASSSTAAAPRLMVGGDGWLPVVRQGAVRKASMAFEEETGRGVDGTTRTGTDAQGQWAGLGGKGLDGEITRTVTTKERGFLSRISEPNDDEYMFGVLFTAFTGFVVTVLFAIRNRRRAENVQRPRS